ncbi:hypothetical protein [Citricoccus sp. K5]|uniref:hypothetical protein n=1 Tax=Citricoccus sp. K5 TaxID=2653135 RepID=UPI00135CAD6D|nr:hypothetical protein [Citricoccus sp. K5]
MNRPSIAAFLDKLVATLEPKDYTTLDCRAGVHGGCETCACHCHAPAVCTCIRDVTTPATVAVPDPTCARHEVTA